MKSITA